MQQYIFEIRRQLMKFIIRLYATLLSCSSDKTFETAYWIQIANVDNYEIPLVIST